VSHVMRSINVRYLLTYLLYGFLFAFHSNYRRIFNRFYTIYERDSQPATAGQQTPRLCIASPC